MKSYILAITVLILSIATSCVPYYIMAPNTSGYIVRIESDTFWEGQVDGDYVSGSSTLGIPVTPRYGRPVCWDIRKSRMGGGMLRAFMTHRDYYAGSDMYPRFGDQVTVAVMGRVQGCHRAW
jgi:hypothetical protein